MTPTLWAAGACGVALIVVSLAMLFGRQSRRREVREQRRKIERHLASAARSEFRERLREQRNGRRAEQATKRQEESRRPQ